ncbi:DUF1613-domain-containing protein [Serendipita vermifera]|nr:DUF1613-domain-containing protein [Serendipita vermifera]
MPQPPRPIFHAEPALHTPDHKLKDKIDRKWIPIVQAVAHFPVQLFESVLLNLVYHPELTSKLILRAEILDERQAGDVQGHSDIGDSHSALDKEVNYDIEGFALCRTIRRKLVPKVPERDEPIEQNCIFYRHEDETCPQLVILYPLLKVDQKMPHYHPELEAIAFRYISPNTELFSTDNSGILRLDIAIKEDQTIDVHSRLFKTCKSLLEIVAKHGWGRSTGYRKRMSHDTVITREIYQDFYHAMKEKYKYLKDEWAESTDATKNVFEDIGIAAFLILLWKDTYPPERLDGKEIWGRPPGGFVDIGCGAGLLVHILTMEGYDGTGLDIRARKSWNVYPQSTQARLHAYALNPLDSGFPYNRFLTRGAFLIGNHADELSPWLPIMASLIDDAAFISIPCCPWSLDQRFHRNTSVYPSLSLEVNEDLHRRLGDTAKSTYGSYICWLSLLASECGFNCEYEPLRIPSTRNWSIIGRRGLVGQDGRTRAREILAGVIERNMFIVRRGVNSNH